MVGSRIEKIVFLLLAVILASGVSALAQDVQDGDLFVGAAGKFINADVTTGAIMRVRGAGVTTFCQSPDSSFDPDFWNIPPFVITDGSARVVFLAPISGNPQGFALLRCSHVGETAEKLAFFSKNGESRPGYPTAVLNQSFEDFSGLHLVRRRLITLSDKNNRGLPHMSNEESYALAVRNTGSNAAKLVRYHPDTMVWDDQLDLAIFDFKPNNSMPDVINHSGSTYSISDRDTRKVKDPLTIEASGTVGGVDFDLALHLFAKKNSLPASTLTDNVNIPNVPSGCLDLDPPIPPPQGASSSMPAGINGTFAPFSANQILFDEYGGKGLVFTSGEGSIAGYLFNVNQALLDDPGDTSQYFQNPPIGDALRCFTISPAIQFTPGPSYFDPDTGIVNLVEHNRLQKSIATSKDGLFGTQFFGANLIKILDTKTEIVVKIPFPEGIAAYPNKASPGLSAVIAIRIDSPVNVLVTSPDGKKIGVDTQGQAVNDFGADGFDSGPGEPRFYFINNPAPGSFAVQSIGTGTGPFTVHVYSMNTALDDGLHIMTSGATSPGASSSQGFTYTGVNINFDCSQNASSSISIARGGFRYNATTQKFVQTITLTNTSGATVQGPISLVLDNLSSNASLSGATGTTACAAPNGSPYISAAASSLGPGASTSLTLQFNDPAKTAITYTTRILAGSGSR